MAIQIDYLTAFTVPLLPKPRNGKNYEFRRCRIANAGHKGPA